MSTFPAPLADALSALLGDRLLTSVADRHTYGYDNSRGHALPDAVALPCTTDEVAAIVRACRAHRVPVVARGRGTNTTGAAVPAAGGVVVSMERMRRIIAIRPGDRCAVVEPGVLNGDLQDALRPHGLFWPPDPTSAAFSSIGGNLACNAGGPRAVKYGDAHALDGDVAALAAAAQGEGCLGVEPAADDAARERLWAARKALSPALRTLAPGKINEDVVVPVSRIPGLVAGVQALATEFALPIVCFGHAGNGNLHVNLMYDPADADQSTRAQAAMARVFALAVGLGGTLSGEHGIGVAKRAFMPQAVDAPTLAMMRAVKAAFDPDGILNPGKLLP